MAVEAGDPETDEADFDGPEVLSEVATRPAPVNS
jgi:hypothetical protein